MVDCTLRQIRLMGFRSVYFEDVDFDNPTFVVGPNGSGKSNFVDAFAFFAEAMSPPLQAVIERRGGFSAVSHRTSARGRPSNVTLRVVLEKPDSDTTEARYYVELRPRKGNDFEVAEEMCVVSRSDESTDGFRRRTVKGSTKWDISVKSLDPAVEANALALPLVGGDKRFRAVRSFLSDMRTFIEEPEACPPGVRGVVSGRNRIVAGPPRCQERRGTASGSGASSWRQRTTGSANAAGRHLPRNNGPTGVERIVLAAGRLPSITVVSQARRLVRRPGPRDGARGWCVAAGRLDRGRVKALPHAAMAVGTVGAAGIESCAPRPGIAHSQAGPAGRASWEAW